MKHVVIMLFIALFISGCCSKWTNPFSCDKCNKCGTNYNYEEERNCCDGSSMHIRESF